MMRSLPYCDLPEVTNVKCGKLEESPSREKRQAFLHVRTELSFARMLEEVSSSVKETAVTYRHEQAVFCSM
jgi:hypothetical protein